MLAHVLLVISMVMLAIQSAESVPAINQAIRKKIEEMRSQMPKGVYGSPPLVPYKRDVLDIDYKMDNMTIIGVLEDVKVERLNTFKVDVIDFHLGPNRLNFAFRWPKVRVTGNYNISTALTDGLQLWGNGPFELILHNIKWNGNLRLSIVKGHLNLAEFYSTLLMGSVESNFQGISGGSETGEFYNQLIEETLPGLLKSHKAQISRRITHAVMPRANRVLNKMRLVDLLHA